MELRDARSIIEDAEQAVAAGNYASAEELLRAAVALQTQTLGPHHPDLANTLNNLGVVCEMTDNPIDAEHYFRRAYSIATATLPPDHPFVATSRQNLLDFCGARGRPVESPPSPPQVAAWLDEPAPTAPPHEPSSSGRSWRPFALGALGVGALLVVILLMARPWGGLAEEPAARAMTETAPAREAPAPPPTPPAEPIAQPEPEPAAEPTPPARSEVDAVGTTPPTSAESTEAPTVVTAQLCTALKVWQCEAADSQVPPGPMFFYTQLKSATATTIEHRWYRGDRLIQAVPLRIQANPGAGYRTYSRNTVTKERAGDWRVELRSADGTLLHEERFTAR